MLTEKNKTASAGKEVIEEVTRIKAVLNPVTSDFMVMASVDARNQSMKRVILCPGCSTMGARAVSLPPEFRL